MASVSAERAPFFQALRSPVGARTPAPRIWQTLKIPAPRAPGIAHPFFEALEHVGVDRGPKGIDPIQSAWTAARRQGLRRAGFTGGWLAERYQASVSPYKH
jgi:hypothetical protein